MEGCRTLSHKHSQKSLSPLKRLQQNIAADLAERLTDQLNERMNVISEKLTDHVNERMNVINERLTDQLNELEAGLRRVAEVVNSFYAPGEIYVVAKKER